MTINFMWVVLIVTIALGLWWRCSRRKAADARLAATVKEIQAEGNWTPYIRKTPRTK